MAQNDTYNDGAGHDRMVRVNISPHSDVRCEEGRPLLECPHCGDFRYRLRRITRLQGVSWIPFVGGVREDITEYYGCDKCGYRQYVDADTNQEVSE